jgi:hypothetical protein
MAIYEAESIKNKIEKSSHYSACFYGDDYEKFNRERDKLYRIRSCYDGIINYERSIIDAYYDIKNRENEINNQNDLFRRNLDSIRNSNENSLTIEKKKKENEINEMRNQLDIYKKQCDCDIKLANEDILNLQKEIKELNLSKNEEIELLKKEKLFELKNEFKVNLLRYKNMKELEKEKKEKEAEIKRKEFEAEKEIKFNEMKNKAELVQKIISMCKNIELN